MSVSLLACEMSAIVQYFVLLIPPITSLTGKDGEKSVAAHSPPGSTCISPKLQSQSWFVLSLTTHTQFFFSPPLLTLSWPMLLSSSSTSLARASYWSLDISLTPLLSLHYCFSSCIMHTHHLGILLKTDAG